MATIDLSGLNSSDTVNVVAGGIIFWMMMQEMLKLSLKAGIDSGHDGKATITFDYDTNGSKITIAYDNLVDNSKDFTETYDYIG